MGFYDNLSTTTKSLLTKFGRQVVRRRYSSGSYDTDTGSVAQTPQDVAFKGALFDFAAGTTEVRGTLVQAQDKNLLLEAAASPLLSDVYIIGGVQYAVVSIAEVNPAGTKVMFELHLRRA